jgi:pyrimidine operon attenuation protein/uracil phosphoribosyltransferase
MDKDVPVLENMVLDLPEGGEFALVDDVLNSGRTLLWAVIKLMSYRPRVLRTTVLVDRSHKRYPVKADLKGLSLSTTLQDTVQLNIVNGVATNVQLV